MVNVVTIKATRYLVDVGYGRREPTQPLPLLSAAAGRDSTSVEVTGIGTTKGKLELKTLPQHTSTARASADADAVDQSVWVYSAWTTTTATTTAEENAADVETGGGGGGGSAGGGVWEEQYSFTEVEFFPEDFEVLNFYIMMRPQSWFVQTVLAYRGILDHETGQLVGELILHKDSVKQQLVLGSNGERSETVVWELRNEEDRVAALERYFFIVLTEKEKRAIRGLASELKAS